MHGAPPPRHGGRYPATLAPNGRRKVASSNRLRVKVGCWLAPGCLLFVLLLAATLLLPFSYLAASSYLTPTLLLSYTYLTPTLLT